ncbi:restriction endonuclease [Candidatus Woesearchaeota archaeon]|nr:restriction endonuclease [Candidatus Woesearchaeota archaeon]
MDTNLIYKGDCHAVLKREFPIGDARQGIDLIYLDPPFSFKPRYKVWYDKETLAMFEDMRKGGVKHFAAWMRKRLEQCRRVLKETGSIYLHCDWQFGHYLKVEMDNIFGRNNFQNELVWYYRGGGVSGKRFGRKHDTIFFYAKSDKGIHTFNVDDIRQPYSEAVLESDPSRYDKSYRKGKVYSGYRPNPLGKHPDDVLLIQPIMPSDKKERTGWLTQKPESLLEVIVKASSNPGDVILDPMCGCGTTIAVAHKLGRKWIGIDVSSQACKVMKERMEALEGIVEVEVRGLPLTVQDLKKLKPFEFEDYICDMTNSERTRHVADQGIDGYYLGESPLQIKQGKSVGRAVVSTFVGDLSRIGKSKGIMIGFAFSKGAYERAAEAEDEGFHIQLIKVDELVRKDYELGNFDD